LMQEKKTIKSWAALDYGQPLQEWTYEADPLSADEVGVEIKACGVCASDIDLCRAKHGKELTNAIGYTCPLVGGHEGVGIVREVGNLVKHIKVGDRVGLGVFRNACGHCNHCSSGNNNLCDQKELMFRNGQKRCFCGLSENQCRFCI